MKHWIHPTVETVLAIHQEVLSAHGGSDGVRELALLESAIAAPQATMSGMPLFTDGVEIAAAYLFYLCQNHPFLDGNKRTALATSLVFLSENGLLENEKLHTDQWEKLVMQLASSSLSREEATRRLKPLLSNP